MSGHPPSARGAAADLISGVLDRGLSLSDQIAAGAVHALAPADRARAQRLALATFRHLADADAILQPHLRKGPPPYISALLRLAVTELLALNGDAHGVVSEAVDLTRRSGRRTEGFAGLVNAVLRKAAATPPADWAARPPQPLPGWLRGRLMSAFGKPATIAIEAAHRLGAPLDLTPRDGDAAALATRLGGTALPTGSVRLTGAPQVSDLPGYAAGDWWVQDAAAALPAQILAPAKGETVLDLCAAPGGKTLQLAAAGAVVTALDLSPARMTRLAENLARCRLTATCVTADALTFTSPAPFDAILLDAPCSATGTIRRHPDLPFLRDATGLRDIAARQTAMIDHALTLLRPGGRLVYATCSLLPEEGERQVALALSRHPGLTANPSALAIPGIDPVWITPEGGLRLRPDFWPDLGGMDGFYVAVLRLPA